MRIMAVVSYDGTNYGGWQRQKNKISVQQIIEDALFEVCAKKTVITGSGRTDAGAHAKAQVFHFDTPIENIPPERYVFCLNNLLPQDISIIKTCLAQENFHARYSVLKKTYIYNMYLSPVVLPLKDRYALRIEHADAQKMQSAARLFIGKHDFTAFCSTGSPVKESVREIYSLDVTACGGEISIAVCGSGFLYNMVRIIAGTLLGIGQGLISEDSIKQALAQKDRKKAGKTLPARGLTLDNIQY